ncbi:MAG: tetratricopeptide repeat protein [Pseudomonadota bacterium]
MAVTPADSDAAFLREVDENLRRDQVADFWRKYGRIGIGLIVAALVALAGYLWWQNHSEQVAGAQGEDLQGAYDKIGSGQAKAAEPKLAELTGSRVAGYRAAALLSQAAVLIQNGDQKGATAKYAAVVGDASFAQPYRDLALVRQTALEFDTLAPQVVIDRLKPLAVKGNAFFGSAGEMTAVAQLRLNQRDRAGALFGAIAKDETVPATIRQRAVQMAGVLGVDAVDQGENGKTK